MTNQSINLEKGFFWPPLNIPRGGGGVARKRCIILKREKLPYQLRIILGKLLYLGVFIQFWANLCGKNLKLYFRGKFFWGQFFKFGGNLKSVVFVQILFFGGFFSFISFLHGES